MCEDATGKKICGGHLGKMFRNNSTVKFYGFVGDTYVKCLEIIQL